MANTLTWADLTLENIRELEGIRGGAEWSSRLSALLGLKDTDSDAQSRTLLEMHSNNLNFAAEQGFSAEATSTFFSIMKSTFQDSMDDLLAVDKSYALFKSTLLRHSVQRPPYSVGVFTLAEIKCINDYVLNGFFRHYKLYRYVFTKEQRLTVGTQNWPGEVVEKAPLPPPLSQAEEQLAEQPVELAEDAVQEIVDQTGEDPVTVREAFAAAVKEELRNIQESMRSQEEAMVEKVAALEALYAPPAEAEAEEEATQ